VHYGCGGRHDSTHACQCHRECVDHGTCCKDFRAECVMALWPPTPSPTPPPPATWTTVTTATSSTTTEERCADVGCGASYDSGRNCQCHLACGSEGNCCHDYNTECVGPEDVDAPYDGDAPLVVDSCEAYGCGESNPEQKCQCDRHCGLNCCSDYIALCVDGDGLQGATETLA
jgi:hypothetical protein